MSVLNGAEGNQPAFSNKIAEWNYWVLLCVVEEAAEKRYGEGGYIIS